MKGQDREREFLECLQSLEGSSYVLSCTTLSLLEAVQQSIQNILLINYKKTLSDRPYGRWDSDAGDALAPLQYLKISW